MKFWWAIVLCVLVAAPAAAQQKPVPRYGEPDKDKSPSEIQAEKDSAAAYQRSLGNIPNQKQTDPWGGVRSDAAAKPAKPETPKADAAKSKRAKALAPAAN